MGRRAGPEVEAIPGPPLRQAQPEPHRALRGFPESPVSPSGARRSRTGTLPGAHLQDCQLSDAHGAPLPVGGDGCVQKRERAVISLIAHETRAGSMV